MPTPCAASYLGIHPKTLLRWHRQGVGPEPEPKGTYTRNCLYWQPAKLRAWWESQFDPPGRDVNEIVFEWMKATPPWIYANWPFPARPGRAVLRRRRRAQVAKEFASNIGSGAADR